MSDPVTNVEIEDVLSSIRRLIADGDRPPEGDGEAGAEAADNEPPATAPEPPAGHGPLVLTPALRVGEAGTDDPLAVARRVARLEAAVTVQDQDFEPDGSETAPPLDWPPALADGAPVFRSRGRAAGGAADEAPDGEAEPPAALPPALPPADTAGEPPPAPVMADGTAATGEDEDDDDPGLMAAVEGAGEDESLFEGLFGTQGLPEEEVLRDLIAEILRDELAGALGERITRNVRKLVRREIFRILSSRELE